MQLCFFLKSPFVEFSGNWVLRCAITTDLLNECFNEIFDPATQRTPANFHPMPELRHWPGKSKPNIAARWLRHNGYDDAFLRLIVCLIRNHYSLAVFDTTCHPDQSASLIDGDCRGLFVKRIATWQRAIDEQREVGSDPARRAVTRVLDNRGFRHFGLLVLDRNNSPQFTAATDAGLLVERTVRSNWAAYLE